MVTVPGKLVGHSGAVLAIDPGSKMGWALWQSNGGMVTSGTERFENNRHAGGGMPYLKFKRWLSDVHEMELIGEVAYEEVRNHKGVTASHAYGGFHAHLTAFCEGLEIPYQGVPVGAIKKHATGKGNAGKEAMIAAMKEKGHQPQDDNEADALAILYWTLEQGGLKP